MKLVKIISGLNLHGERDWGTGDHKGYSKGGELAELYDCVVIKGKTVQDTPIGEGDVRIIDGASTGLWAWCYKGEYTVVSPLELLAMEAE